MGERFNFSKEADQKLFLEQNPTEQDREVEKSHEEALETNRQYEELIDILDNKNFTNNIEFIDFQEVLKDYPKELLNQVAIQRKVLGKLLQLLEAGKTNELKYLIKTFQIPDEALQSPEVQSAAKESLISLLWDVLSDGGLEFVNTFKIPVECLRTPEVQSAATSKLVKFLWRGSGTEAKTMIQVFQIPETLIRDVVIRGLINLFKNDVFDESKNIVETLKESCLISEGYLSTPDLQEAAKGTLTNNLSWGNFKKVVYLIDTFQITDDYLETAEVQTAAEAGLTCALEESDISASINIAKYFKLNNSFDVIKSRLNEIGWPVSLDTTAKIIDNDRFGSNLLTKFPHFDKPAKEAIGLILECDEAIPPELDRRSTEYRKKVLDRVRAFKRNPEICKVIEQSGADVEAWLTYDQVDYFTLGQADELTTAEQIKTPVERLAPSFAAYTKAMKGVIGEFRKELFTNRIAVDTTELEAQRDELVARMKAVSDVAKHSGMEKGLAALDAQITNPKVISVWDKIMSEFSKLTKLAESITVNNNELEQLEKNPIQITDDESLKVAQTHKASTWQTRQTLVKELNLLHNRYQDIFQTLEDTLSPAIGIERASGIRQEVQSTVGEHIDHLSSDFATIFSFIKEPEIEDQQNDQVPDEMVMNDGEYSFSPTHAKQLEGRPMSIRVAGRSRQDLYIGNYTTCCIRIDSDYHRAESPIADYLTDVGMQNVLIYDEVSGTPVACAWCWLGYHKDSKEPALVIDNVEGWQKYTVNFQSQLNEQLRTYLEAYANAIGVKTLTQGPDYNDLNPIPNGAQGEWCFKLGGSNRPDKENGVCGYYLEAEYTNDLSDGVGEEEE